MALLDQLPTLVGVVIGAGTSYLLTAAGERTRWRRQQAARWDERRLVAYADYARAVKEVCMLSLRLAASRGLVDSPSPLANDAAALAEIAAAEDRRGHLLEDLRLLTDTDTITATRALNHALWQLSWMAHGTLPATRETWSEAFREYRAARDEYHRCARASVGIIGSAVSRDQTWPPRWRPPPPS
ncbi:hypothetical protein ACODT3_02105 [Streptomyces sp. 4.24]|uniref:hypothetical protein n=1 Tax=Streptomyces tritrimontium TaxID=3406573 RepID=UPI003BB749E2